MANSNNENLTNSIKNFPNVSSKVCQKLNETSQNGQRFLTPHQSGEISPKQVTLLQFFQCISPARKNTKLRISSASLSFKTLKCFNIGSCWYYDIGKKWGQMFKIEQFDKNILGPSCSYTKTHSIYGGFCLAFPNYWTLRGIY